ncbi:translocon-associated protein subunit alpha-like [Chenopodium quinoa]|nr:translocon-associated protein subunit alpha-like [Chenopodium quinoa]
MAIRVFFLALLFLASPFLQVARCQSEPTDDPIGDSIAEEMSDLGVVNDDTQVYGDESLSSAPGVETAYVFPKNSGKVVTAGEESEVLIGIKYDGDASFSVVAIHASVHLPYDHRLLVQNLTAQVFNNASVPSSAQATFPYVFAVSKYLQPGSFDLVGSIVYEIDKTPYQSTFFNGTIEVTEASGPLTIETVFLVMLAFSLVAALGLWIRGQLQRFSKKSKKAPKVEVGTRSTDASLDEWLQGTAYTQANKLKKK